MVNTLVALYSDLATAQDVLMDLRGKGFEPADVSLVAHNAEPIQPQTDELASFVEGTSFGALVGGLTGLVVGLVAITVPGIGPVIAAGPLAAVLGGATGTAIGVGTGAVIGGLAGELVNLSVSPEEADRYASGIREGKVLMTVKVRLDNVNDAINVMSYYAPIDIQYYGEKRQSHDMLPDQDVTEPAYEPATHDGPDTEDAQLLHPDNPEHQVTTTEVG